MLGLGLDYPSSSDDETIVPPKRRKVSTEPSEPGATQRITPAKAPKTTPKAAGKLPSLPVSFDSASRAHDNPEAHQGRRRARPFVDGDYYAHVYVELDVSPALGKAVDAIVSDARGAHSLLHEPSSTPPTTSYQSSPTLTQRWRPLHVSISHPLPLRRDMVRSFAPTVAHALGSTSAFRLSLAGAPVVYYNTPGKTREAGRGTPTVGGRAFLGLRVGAGARELAALLAKLEGVLERLHLPLYHDEPDFHASFAWALCRGGGERQGDGGERDGNGHGEEGVGTEAKDENDEGEEAATPFPPHLVDRLAARTDIILAAHPGWRVSSLCVKIAKDVVRIPL